VEHHLAPLAWSHKHGDTIEARRDDLLAQDFYQEKSESEKLGFLRSKAISNLTKATVQAFMDHESDLLNGRFDNELLAVTPFAEEAQACKKFAGQSIFGTRRKLEIETASFELVDVLLSRFCGAMQDLEKAKGDRSAVSQKSMRLLNMMDNQPFDTSSRYQTLLQVTDFISGLSDRAAVNLANVIRGNSI
jgi:dGTPase